MSTGMVRVFEMADVSDSDSLHHVFDLLKSMVVAQIQGVPYWDTRAAMVLGAKQDFEKLKPRMPLLVAQAIIELDALMPTPEQIAAARHCTVNHGTKLKPIRPFESASPSSPLQQVAT